MIKRIRKKHSKDQVLNSLDPIIIQWFNNNFKDLTPAQAYAIPLIRDRKNVLVASPTGSGKTLTAFLMILDQLFQLGKLAKLENKVYCIYISPLKALANDIERNLNLPLKQIYALAEDRGFTLPEIRVGVRSGDTSTYERQKMLRKAPHILITTPESLSLIISTKRFRYMLLDAQFVIVDEIHEICSSKRGVQLSLSLERLQNQILTEGLGKEFIRIGLSATQAPISEIAKFLGGYDKDGKLRDMNIVEVPTTKKLDLKIICPVNDMNLIPFEIVNAKMYDILYDQIKMHRSTLIFTNTRSGAETMAFKLHEKGMDHVAAHHGSLSKETRLEVEDKLKNGELDATICSTSLELGIDIGFIDLVCQIGSPKSIAKGLQRIGRSGHALHDISKGRIIVFDRDDLVECAVLVKNAYDGNIDRINILRNNLDVLAQSLVGMSLVRRWEIDETFSIIKQSYCYHQVPKKDFLEVMKYIGGKHTLEDRGVYGKVRYYPDEQVFGIRHGTRSIYNLNIGTIPQEANYKVIILGTGYSVGVLSEKFVEHLTNKDVIVLGGKTYEFIQTKGMNVYVKDAQGRKPTVPSWTGEMLPRSFDLSVEIGKFRSELGRRLEGAMLKNNEGVIENKNKNNKKSVPSFTQNLQLDKLESIENWLMDEYYLDTGSAKSIINYFIEQYGLIDKFPTNKRVLIEGYIDARGYKNIIFHYCFGRRINDALARAYAQKLSLKLNSTVRISLTDDNFMLTFPKHIELTGIEGLVTSEQLRDSLKTALKNTELFKQRFRHCAVRSFMILRNYKGKDISVRKQLRRSSRILDILHELDSFPVINEAYNEIMHNVMDIKNATAILKKIESGEISVSYSDYSKIPSPFAHNVILIGVSDIILMEDRSALLRELHQQVLNKVFGTKEFAKPKFDNIDVNNYFKKKFLIIEDKNDIVKLITQVGPLKMFKEKGKNIYSYVKSEISRHNLQTWASELVAERKIVSIYRNNDLYWIPIEQMKYYTSIYSDIKELSGKESLVLSWLAAAGDQGKLVPKRKSSLRTKSAIETIESKSTIGVKGDGINDLDIPLPLKELHENLKLLEKRYLVNRSEEKSDGTINWYIIKQDVKQDPKPDFEYAIDFLILQYLRYYAPAPISEIAYDLNVTEEVVASRLSELEGAAEVVAGNFIFGKELPQYILMNDHLSIDQKFGDDIEKIPFFEEKITQNYLVNKVFQTVENINEYFKKFSLAFGVREVFIRTKNFTMDKWNRYLTGSGQKIVQGRFLNGRVCYVPLDDLPIYASAYRVSTLTSQELTVLNYIKSQRGITRKELSKRLDARQQDLKEIIDKLERNVYIIREPSKYDLGTKLANRYKYYKLDKKVENSELLIIEKILKSQAPITLFEIQNLTGFSSPCISHSLDALCGNGKVVKFKTGIGNSSEQYISKDEFDILLSNKKPVLVTEVTRVLSLFDSYGTRLLPELRVKFGEGWLTPVIYFGKLVGVLDQWRLSDCIEVREIRLDDGLISAAHKLIPDDGQAKAPFYANINDLKLEILEQILLELDRLMDYYNMHGLEIVRIRSILGNDVESMPDDVLNILSKSGYTRLQNFFAKGKLDENVFNFKQIINLILEKQHILPNSRFIIPLDAVRIMGGIRSNLEMQLRLDAKFYDVKEFRKNLNLAAGPVIPDNYTYCTEKDLRIYKTAKGRSLDLIMEYVLANMPDDVAISSSNLFARLTLSHDQFNDARKKLYEGLFIIRDPLNKYIKVGKYRNLTKNYARKYILKRIINNFGIFSSENLSAFTKREFSMKELRSILHELEIEGVVKKGYFIEGDDTLYWMNNSDINDLVNHGFDFTFSQNFIVSPHDQLATYLAPFMRKHFGMGSCYIIFHGLDITGAFKIKQKNKKIWITEFKGNEEDWGTVEKYFRENRLELVDEESEELYTYNDDL